MATPCFDFGLIMTCETLASRVRVLENANGNPWVVGECSKTQGVQLSSGLSSFSKEVLKNLSPKNEFQQMNDGGDWFLS